MSGGVGVTQEEAGEDEGNGSSTGTTGQQNAAKLVQTRCGTVMPLRLFSQ